MRTPQYGDVFPITLNPPTSRRCLYTVRLVIGDIDDADVIEFFTASKCHLLACALHEETGYKLSVLRMVNEPDWWHAGVICGGDFVDILGPRPIDDAIAQYSANNSKVGGEAAIEIYDDILDFYAAISASNTPNDPDWWCNDGGFKFVGEYEGLVIGDFIRPFAKTLLQRYPSL